MFAQFAPGIIDGGTNGPRGRVDAYDYVWLFPIKVQQHAQTHQCKSFYCNEYDNLKRFW